MEAAARLGVVAVNVLSERETPSPAPAGLPLSALGFSLRVTTRMVMT